MEEQLIKFETAKLAKEKGFNEECRSYYDIEFQESSFHVEFEGFRNSEITNGYWKLNYAMISAPTQSFLQKWLREEHNIDIMILGTHGDYYVGIDKKDFHNLPKYFYPNSMSYENTLEIGLQEALKLI